MVAASQSATACARAARFCMPATPLPLVSASTTVTARGQNGAYTSGSRLRRAACAASVGGMFGQPFTLVNDS